jgi:hypothetical protein
MVISDFILPVFAILLIGGTIISFFDPDCSEDDDLYATF